MTKKKSKKTSEKLKHVYITGAAGFIGSHICDLLLSKGYAVSGIDNFVTGNKKNLANALKNKNFKFLEWDACDPIPENKFPFFKQHKLFGVFHFACPASPVDFDKIPLEILAVDSVGTMKTVDLAMKYGARLILASTSEVYGDPLVHPQKEEYWGNVNTIGPRACYDETKRFAEAYVTSAMRGVGKGKVRKHLDARIVRIFNTYGPRMRPNDGRVVPELCIQALNNRPLTVHGEGKQTRSFCYVSDLVDGIVRLFESDYKLPMNIGNPVENTIIQFADTVIKLAHSSSTINHLPERPDDPKRRCPDITKAKNILGWTPKVNLEEGLQKSLDFFRSTMKSK